MAGHKPIVVTSEDGRAFYARCIKHFSGPKRDHRWQAEDDVLEHMKQVERALANLRRGQGTLRSERDHARTMLEHPNTPAEAREAWRVLYEGANQRLNDTDPVLQEALF